MAVDPTEAKRRAMKAWAAQAQSAFPAFLRELMRSKAVVERSEAETIATDTVSWLANLIVTFDDPPDFILAQLRRVRAATLPTLAADAVKLGEEVVTEMADAYKAAKKDGSDEDGRSPSEVAERTAMLLCALVHNGFEPLQRKRTEVEAELARFGTGRGKKIGATSVLGKLNQLAGNPLGLWGASASYVREAKRPKKKRVR